MIKWNGYSYTIAIIILALFVYTLITIIIGALS